MIVAKTKCCECGCEIELDDEFGWNSLHENADNIICDECDLRYYREIKEREEDDDL